MALLSIVIGSAAEAATLTVDLTDRRDEPVPGAAVFLLPADPGAPTLSRAAENSTVVMEQIDSAFVPHLLVVQTGTHVSFPNNDSVSHHVYSFSDAKRFQLDLYRGNTHPPQLFEQPGLVVLGCNIHDSMLGYILVVDTPLFAVTDENGTVRIDDVPGGDYEVLVWTPRANPDDLPAPQTVSIGDPEDRIFSAKLNGKLRPAHTSDEGSLSWTAY